MPNNDNAVVSVKQTHQRSPLKPFTVEISITTTREAIALLDIGFIAICLATFVFN